jgi:hypothetical protein
MVHEAVDMLEKALPNLPPADPIHKAVLHAIGQLSKLAPPQAASPGVGRQALQQLLQQKMSQSPIAALMAGRAGGGAPGGAPGAAGLAPPPSPEAGGAPPA